MKGFDEKMNELIQQEKSSKEVSRTCFNFWCKAPYRVKKENLKENMGYYGQCPKCRSFSNELSGGVENNGTKEYEGERTDPDNNEMSKKEYPGQSLFKKWGKL